MKVKVWLDDIRPAPAGWIRVYWPEEAIELLKTGDVEEISLDHDLGDYMLTKPPGTPERTGYDVILWIEMAVFTENFVPPTIMVHTANWVAEKKMLQAVERIMAKARENLSQ